MARCPKCSYQLVLLFNRSKYKCALCSKLYPQKEIENKEFRRFNEGKRLSDVEDYQKQRKEELLRIKQLKKSVKQLFKPIKNKNDYYKEYKQKNKAKIQEWLKQNKLAKDYKNKIKHRLYHYRLQQKQLTLQYLKNCKEKLYINEIFKSPPTFALCEVLNL